MFQNMKNLEFDLEIRSYISPLQYNLFCPPRQQDTSYNLDDDQLQQGSRMRGISARKGKTTASLVCVIVLFFWICFVMRTCSNMVSSATHGMNQILLDGFRIPLFYPINLEVSRARNTCPLKPQKEHSPLCKDTVFKDEVSTLPYSIKIALL